MMNRGRAPGKDAIPAEIYKVAGFNALAAFHDILQSIWVEEVMPEDFRVTLIVALHKNKGNKADCGYYRDISPVSVVGKTFARILFNQPITISDSNLPKAQCGVPPGLSTVNMTYAV